MGLLLVLSSLICANIDVEVLCLCVLLEHDLVRYSLALLRQIKYFRRFSITCFIIVKSLVNPIQYATVLFKMNKMFSY